VAGKGDRGFSFLTGRAELKAERTYTMLTVEMVPGLDSGFVPGLVSSLVPLFRGRAERVREKRTMVPLFIAPGPAA
jgi:hypothetical protein